MWCSPDWGKGETGSGRAVQRWQSAPAIGGWLHVAPGGLGGLSCPGQDPCLLCGTESKQMKLTRKVMNQTKISFMSSFISF